MTRHGLPEGGVKRVHLSADPDSLRLDLNEMAFKKILLGGLVAQDLVFSVALQVAEAQAIPLLVGGFPESGGVEQMVDHVRANLKGARLALDVSASDVGAFDLMLARPLKVHVDASSEGESPRLSGVVGIGQVGSLNFSANLLAKKPVLEAWTFEAEGSQLKVPAGNLADLAHGPGVLAEIELTGSPRDVTVRLSEFSLEFLSQGDLRLEEVLASTKLSLSTRRPLQDVSDSFTSSLTAGDVLRTLLEEADTVRGRVEISAGRIHLGNQVFLKPIRIVLEGNLLCAQGPELTGKVSVKDVGDVQLSVDLDPSASEVSRLVGSVHAWGTNLALPLDGLGGFKAGPSRVRRIDFTATP